MNPSFALGQRSWCSHSPCSERRCWATPWSRGAGWTQPCVRRPDLITHGTDAERGPRRDARRVPSERTCRVRLPRTGSPRRGSGGRKRRGGWVSVSDPSWPCVARLPRKSPRKSAKCPCDPSLVPWRFASLPRIPARCARLSVPQDGGSPRRERCRLHPWLPRAAPSPSTKSVTAPAGLSRNRPPGKEGRRQGAKRALGEAGAAPGRALGRVSAQGRAVGVESRRKSSSLQGLERGAPLQKASWGGAACLAPFFRPPPLGTGR